MKIYYLIFFAFLLIFLSCNEKRKRADTITNDQTADTSSVVLKDTIAVAIVGAIAITEQTVQYRISTEKAYDNNSLTKITGLIMLINDALEIELARAYKQQALPDEILLFKQHADATSKAREILNKVKQVYGSDISSYDLWYITPKIVNRKIRDYFSSNKEINESALNKIKPALRLIKTGKKMKDVSNSLHLNYAIDSIIVKPADITPALQNYPDATLPFENQMLKYVSKIKIGEVYPEIIEENYSFMIIRVLNSNKDRYLIERISVQKPDFDTWFKKKAEAITIQIKDAEIKQEIKSKYGNLWWATRLK